MNLSETEDLAQRMIKRSFATGHGDTVKDLLAELFRQLDEHDARYKALCTRAADALEDWGQGEITTPLIAELRKAAAQ